MNSRRFFFVLSLVIFLGAANASAQENISYKVTWNPVSDPGVSQIYIYRSLTLEPGDFIHVGTVGVSSTEYRDDSGLAAGVRYYYRLKSRNAASVLSGFSEVVSAMTIVPSCSEEIKAECRVNSATSTGGSSWQINWITEQLSTGELEYWKMGTTAYQVSDPVTVPGTDHQTGIYGLDDDSIYFIHATAYDESHLNMTISFDFTFATSTGVEEIEFVLDPGSVTVEEGRTAEFEVRLSSVPAGDVEVSVSRISGDSDIEVESGAALVFTPHDWYIPRAVILSASEDVDEIHGEAIIRISSVSGPAVADANLIATEEDNDTGANNTLASAIVAIYPMPYQPASGTMTIGNLPNSGNIGIYDLRGQKVWDESWEGSTTLNWTGVNNSGEGVASGRYFVVISNLDGRVSEKRVILVVN